MRRPVIPDLAKAAGVSVATVNRVLSGAANVRLATRERVQKAAEEIGFYGLGSIQARVSAARPHLRFGVLLLQTHRPFYQNVARALEAAARATTEAESKCGSNSWKTFHRRTPPTAPWRWHRTATPFA